MADILLVDSSAWVLSFRSSGPEELRDLLSGALDSDRVATTEVVVMELLQGCRTRREYNALEVRLGSLLKRSVSSLDWGQVNELGFSLRRKGLTIPTVDLIIASVALQGSCTLLHHDRHFQLIAGHSSLKVIDFMQ